jgi:16S rRNA (uracil1498-N3)-methyltransferase
MTRRRFYAPPAAFGPDQRSATLSAEEARHARDVLRLRQADEVYVFDGEGKEFRCALREFTRDGAALDVIDEVAPARPESPLDLTLVLALLKHEKFDLVIQKATELGVNRIIPLSSDRADVVLRDDEDKTKRLSRWRRIALEAAKQSGRARVPEISAPIGFSSLLAHFSANPANTLRVMFSEREGNSLSVATETSSSAKCIVALIGPKGGWSDEEIKLAREQGWRIVTLGGRTLRAETAAISVIALLQHRFGDLK